MTRRHNTRQASGVQVKNTTDMTDKNSTLETPVAEDEGAEQPVATTTTETPDAKGSVVEDIEDDKMDEEPVAEPQVDKALSKVDRIKDLYDKGANYAELAEKFRMTVPEIESIIEDN